MGKAAKYKKIGRMIVTLALAVAITDALEIKYFHRAPLGVTGKQYWRNKENDRDYRVEVPANLNIGMTEIEKDRDRRGFEVQRPSVALTGRNDLTSNDHSLNLRSIMTKTKCPSLKISLGLLSSYECDRSEKQKCKTDKCHGKIEKWSMQQPFYVEEPKWVEIELDYAENLPHDVNMEDPFFLSRGKKIFGREESNNDYEGNDKFPDEFGTTRSRDFMLEDNRIKRNGLKRKNERKKMLQLSNRHLGDLMRQFDPIDDPFFLSRGKKLSESDGIVREISLNDFEESADGKSHRKTKRSLIDESNEITKPKMNSSMIEGNETSSRPKETEEISRTKRMANEEPKIRLPKDTKDHLRRRDKHSDLSDLFDEPFFISRGKKTSRDIDYDTRGKSVDYDESLNSLTVEEKVLQELLESRLCKTTTCQDPNKFLWETDASITDRDRRSALDDLLRKYDPFYVARGKKMRLNDFYEN